MVSTSAPAPARTTMPMVMMSPISTAIPATPVAAAPITGVISPSIVRTIPSPAIVPSPAVRAITPIPPKRVTERRECISIHTIGIYVPIPRVRTVNYIPVQRTADTDSETRIAETDDTFSVFIVVFCTIEFARHPFSVQIRIRFFFYI